MLLDIEIKYAKKNKMVNRMIALFKSVDQTIKCKDEKKEVWLNASDIYYIESVDKKTFIYSEKKIYECELRLYQLLENLLEAGFVQVSKSCIINSNVLQNVKTLMNSRLEATLMNGEKVNVTRKYLSSIKDNLNEKLGN